MQRQRSCAQACTYSSRGAGPGSSRRLRPSAAARTRRTGGRCRRRAWAGHSRPCPPPAPSHRCGRDSRARAGQGPPCPRGPRTASGLFTFCMFPNSTGLKATPGGVKAFSRAGGRRGPPAPPAEAPGDAHPRRGTPVGLQAVVIPAEAARVVQTYCPARAAGGGAGEQARGAPRAATSGAQSLVSWVGRPGTVLAAPSHPRPSHGRTMAESSRFHRCEPSAGVDLGVGVSLLDEEPRAVVGVLTLGVGTGVPLARAAPQQRGQAVGVGEVATLWGLSRSG